MSLGGAPGPAERLIRSASETWESHKPSYADLIRRVVKVDVEEIVIRRRTDQEIVIRRRKEVTIEEIESALTNSPLRVLFAVGLLLVGYAINRILWVLDETGFFLYCVGLWAYYYFMWTRYYSLNFGIELLIYAGLWVRYVVAWMLHAPRPLKLVMLLMLVPAASATNTTAAPPHIFHVIVDDLGWGNTGYHRATPTAEVQTPHMDALVADGVELYRQYVHPECTPSRVSFLTGRLPMHSGQPGLCSPTDVHCGAPYTVTTIAQKMASAGYKTHIVGKWDVGMATPTHTPVGRGFDSGLSYFGHGNYQWSERIWDGSTVNSSVVPVNGTKDLWDGSAPATAAVRASGGGVYEEMIFRDRIAAILHAHPTELPLFLCYTARIAHYPIQAPPAYQKLPHIAAIETAHRRVYHAQIAFLDDQLANITGMLKARRMWETTLMALTTDNGGYTKALGPCSPFDPVRGQTCMSGEAGANNYPLRGGKYSLWEGGIRGNAFVSGGLLPAAVRGTRLHGLMHICDWYSTYSALAGVSPADPTGEAAGVPPVDGLNMWPMLSGANLTSPRREIYVDDGALIVGDYKLLTAKMSSAAWPGPVYPNASSVGNTLDQYTADCRATPCLYDVATDMTEHDDLAASQPGRVASMLARLQALRRTRWVNKSEPYVASCEADQDEVFESRYGGFLGPWCELS